MGEYFGQLSNTLANLRADGPNVRTYVYIFLDN